MENRYKLNYDIKQKCVTNAKFMQGDTNSATLEITLFDNGTIVDMTGETLEFRFAKSDGTYTTQDATTGVSFIDATLGNFQCVLMAETLSTPGVVKCEIHREKSGNTLSTDLFNFVVKQSVEGKVLLSNYIASVENKIIEWQGKENIRQTNFDTNEDLRQVKANTSETTRQTTFNTNETTRGNTFNINETSRQTGFSQIKADYNTYKNVMIDSSNVANLQNQINNLRIADNTANKKYTFQIQVNNGKPQLIYTEVI